MFVSYLIIKVVNIRKLECIVGMFDEKLSTSSSSGRLEEGRAVVLSLFILPPPELTLLAAGVLDRGYARPLEPIVLVAIDSISYSE